MAVNETAQVILKELSDKCMQDRQAGFYVAVSGATFFAALIIVLVPRILSAPCVARKQKNIDEKLLVEPSMYINVQNWAGDLISGNTTTGRILVVFTFVCSIVAMGLYIYDTHEFLDLERCVNWKDAITLQIDFALSIVFIFYFIIRFIATDDKVMFMISLESLVDFFTIPPVYLSVYYDRAWLGLRFLRALIFMNLPDVLVYVRVINLSSEIRLTKLCSIFLASVMACAGLCFFLENSGDPWRNYENRHDPYLGYGDCLYYMFITMSTVGYGDIFCVTDWGRIFIIFYVCQALVMFANFLPEIVQLVGNRPRFAGEYEPDGRQFIVVAGNVNYESVQTFLGDFFHPARDDVDVEVVFLNKLEPDLEFEGLLKREHTRVQYFKGSMLNAYDLQRVRCNQAAACLVLANKFSEEPDVEDAANIMRVISLKNYCEDTRVIIQLMMYHNKGYLLNIPGWDWRRDDQAVCLNELKLGFIAQSCLAPGFSTLVSNLVIISSPDLNEDVPKWKRDYFTACNKVILAETLSPTFVGLQFKQVAEICYTQLNLLLLAIEARKYEGGEIYINPKDKVINPNAIGLFMTDSADSAKRAWFYCRKCHANIKSETEVTKCDCKRTAVRHLEKGGRSGTIHRRKNKHNIVEEILDFEGEETADGTKKRNKLPRTATSIDVDGVEQSKMQYDSTGMYHWCPSRGIEECLMDRQDAAMTVLQDHVIVAVFANDDSPLIGLRNLVMPLRASNIHFNELLQVVIVGNVDYLRREWRLLQNLPKINVLNGSPLSRADLRAVKVDMCRMCVILSAKIPSRIEPVLADKEVILTALNVKAMTFVDEDDSLDESDKLNRRNSILGDLMEAEGPVSRAVPIIVDLAFSTNVRFLDDHELHLDDVELYKTLPYAAGQALARGILDSLMSTTYFNASALRLIRSWVTGGATIELELALAEGAGLRGGYTTPSTLKSRDRFRVAQVALQGSVFSKIAEEGYPFGVLFAEASSKYGMLCIGIYRLVVNPRASLEACESDSDSDSDMTRVKKKRRPAQVKGEDPGDTTHDASLRIVISAPNKNMPLEVSDMAFMLVQYQLPVEDLRAPQ
ncbi:calcium-activated potassium channel slowpoke-like isoform X2 [Tigriopus californicus]|uniref:calcium-activated potassium channel slowpoke-like isoform X2 n=1 Tax=Tigriopus californicus TaxID=6832 RepID=UPI0027D9E325|nr:calcium-activated potassium channel slowpoke-like isoform X2 [Tigriopus californicus]